MTVENTGANGKNTGSGVKKTTAAKATPATKATATKATESESTNDTKSLALSVPQKRGLPQNRPIEPSHLNVVDTYSSVGSSRPITRGTVEVSSTLTISGNRPIALSGLEISDTVVIMGNRPVASNEIDDASTLMGYLD